ncbi:sulfotransferase family protein, partial [Candidatus Parcubacteria bacterium]
EILASQRKMLLRRGEDPDKIDDAELARLFAKHLQHVETWLAAQPHIACLDVHYNQVLQDPRPHVERIRAFLNRPLDTDAMCAVVDPSLYRQRVQ